LLVRVADICSVVLSVGLSVGPSVGNDHEFWGKTAEWIEMLFRVVSVVDSRNLESDGRAHWRRRAYTVERLCAAAVNESATRDGDAASFQITLSNIVVTLPREGCQVL